MKSVLVTAVKLVTIVGIIVVTIVKIVRVRVEVLTADCFSGAEVD